MANLDNNKRQSVQGRVATPKAQGNSSSGAIDIETALTKAVGSRVRLSTRPFANLPSSLEGILFTFSPSLRLLALATTNTLSPPAPTEYRVIPLNVVLNVTALNGPSFDEEIGSLVGSARLDSEALRKREETAVNGIKNRDSTRNRTATKEGQAIFDWFSRSLPTRWNENTIIVNNNVRIDPPYRIDDCKAQKDKKQAEAHIKKVLAGYYERKPASKAPAVTPALPRKGG